MGSSKVSSENSAESSRVSPSKPIRIMFVGDINLGEYYTSFGHGPRTYAKTRNPFEHVLPLLQQADLVVGNLEAPLTRANFDPKEPESVVLRGDPQDARYLAEANFKVLQIANNHTVQHGEEGFNETVETLRSHGILPIGLNGQPLQTIQINGERLGFLSASDVPDNTNKAQISYQRFDEDFKALVKRSVRMVDHLFVVLHWGLESSTAPMEHQKEYASELANAGIRGVIGQHPHLFYPVWQEINTVVAPSLGNFIFDLCWDQRLINSGILDLTISQSKISWKVWPVELTENGATPKISGAAQEPSSEVSVVSLFDLGESMAGEQTRKLKYFLGHLHKGNALLKAKFIMRKLFPIFKSKTR